MVHLEPTKPSKVSRLTRLQFFTLLGWQTQRKTALEPIEYV